MTIEYVPAIADVDLPEGGKVGLRLKGWPVLLCRVDGTPLAVIDRCPHAASALAEGRVRRGAIMCPLHGARFDLASGRCIGGPYAALKTFPVEVADGMIRIGVPDEPPMAEHIPVMPV